MVLKYAILALTTLPGGLGDGIRQLGSQQDDAASNACNRLKDAYPEYYTFSAWLGLACVFEPSNSTQMSEAVQILKEAKSPFAIRGGGHMPIANAANINSSGVSFGLSQLSLSEDHPTVNPSVADLVMSAFLGISLVAVFPTSATSGCDPDGGVYTALGKARYSAILFYNGENTSPGALKSFLGADLNAAIKTFFSRSMSKWCKELDPALSLLKGRKQRFYVLNIHAFNRQAISLIHDTFTRRVTEKFITTSTVNGGDPQSLDINGTPYLWVEESITSAEIVSDKDVGAFYKIVNGQIVDNHQAAGIEMARFIYLNDANPSQDAFGTFPPENLARLKSIRTKYDPDRVFTDLMPGGFKVVRPSETRPGEPCVNQISIICAEKGILLALV
ncbi:hypothetical protein ETB97_001272 [Aspergillus alliaceus]|uniref:Uncharacterized protein n=1 Tax=Petromyces alliaceus TaxID=209559 RepID=A0A5N6FZI6_PETAA|nr:uncharacterized protein BDW43DRAFT_309316 [Aspergillus alliaceus]KAB8235451.1 hypothetical protein BDW43DRAFT_309316 [Aspergillus alliaceus]KAF5860639.1 hypothetical protein ETB97_001272 [Aspergillus burnettii]